MTLDRIAGLVPERFRSRELWKRVLRWTALCLVLFAVTGFFILPPIIKSQAVKHLSAALHRTVSIKQVKVNPFVLSVDILGLSVAEKAGEKVFVSVDRLHLDFQAVSIFKRGIILREVLLERPYLNIVRNRDATYNFTDLLLEFASDKKPATKPLRFSLNNIRISDGSVDFLDGPRKTSHTVRALHFAIPFLSTFPYYADTYVQPYLEADVNTRHVAFRGMTKPFTDSLETVFDINIASLDIPYYLAYAPFPLRFRLNSALLDVQGSLSYIQYTNRPPNITFTGSSALRDVSLDDHSGAPLLRLRALEAAADLVEPLKRQARLSRVLIAAPEFHFTRNAAGTNNLEALLPPKQEDESVNRKETAETSFLLTMAAFEIKDGTTVFRDAPQGRLFVTTLSRIGLTMERFSTDPSNKTAFGFSAITEADEGITVKGDLSLFPLRSNGTFELNGLLLRKYAPYYSGSILFGVESGTLDLASDFRLSMDDKSPEMLLQGLHASLRSLQLKKADEPDAFLSLPVAAVAETSLDLEKRTIALGTVTTERGMLVVRKKAGGMNVANLLPPAAEAKPVAKATTKKGDIPWTVSLAALSADRCRVRIEDALSDETVTTIVDQIKIRAANLSTEKNRKGKASISCVLNSKGIISFAGGLTLEPLSADLRLDVRGAEILPFQPYFADRINIVVADGQVNAGGNLKLGQAKDKTMTAAFRGEFSLNHLYTVDKANADDFLKWDTLHFGSVDIAYNPLSVHIGEVALSTFYTRLIINDDGSLNLQDIFVAAAAAGPAAPQPAGPAVPEQPPAGTPRQEPPPIRVDAVVLQGGSVNFSDRHIRPNYSANLEEITGRVTGLSSEEQRMGDVDLQGRLDHYAPLEITGKINPLRKDLYVDLKANFRDIELSPVTPYSGRYLGYTIQKGKLSLDMQYLIVKKKLDAQQHIFLDQFTLGDHVESPEATKLPVKLAIALLKNRKGEIKLDIPVSGYIDDPKFSIGSIVIKILLNLLVKAATSPFALLGALFGGGEELSYVEFEYGLSAISPDSAKKLDTLVKALSDRPALKLEIEGHADLEKDREGLRQVVFQRKLKSQKQKELIKKGTTAAALDDVIIASSEYAQYLKLAYKEERFPKPRNIIGIAKDLPVPEMEKLILTHIEIKDEDLRALALQRSHEARDRILQSKQVEPERVFLLEPKSIAPEKKEKAKESRVDFRLK